jgi:ABC-type transport system involved in cytochrome bd biosynthesis fused ATPase/permease subunit
MKKKYDFKRNFIAGLRIIKSDKFYILMAILALIYAMLMTSLAGFLGFIITVFFIPLFIIMIGDKDNIKKRIESNKMEKNLRKNNDK